MTAPGEQATYWAEKGPAWVEFEAHLRRVGAPFGQLVMDRLGVSPGERVLDVGCGTGATTIALAQRVGTDGEAVGIDLSPRMLERARSRAADEGVGNVRFLEADAQQFESDGAFDVVFSQFGVMFFNDPVAAFSNLRRELRPGGRMGFSCWQDLFSNEWLLVPGMAIVTLTGEMPSMPEDAPGPFSLAEPEQVEGVLGAAGFSDIVVRPHEEIITIAEPELEAFARADVRVGAGAELLPDADEDLRSRAQRAIHDAMAERVDDGEVRLTASALVVEARRA